jgi:hypothetical protein
MSTSAGSWPVPKVPATHQLLEVGTKICSVRGFWNHGSLILELGG